MPKYLGKRLAILRLRNGRHSGDPLRIFLFMYRHGLSTQLGLTGLWMRKRCPIHEVSIGVGVVVREQHTRITQDSLERITLISHLQNFHTIPLGMMIFL
ncbi:hypothetical protein V8J82_06505 [Gymnodinialimonas sp. 2305UL16-5]|uniref:hypothetical protein n=1 Tax=Gymnodinialimonas mytili TaxID=3126503 RepID=UPI00309E674C